MRTEALNNKYVYGTPIQGSRLVLDLADMHQNCTQSYVRRPYGVGLLIATHDQTGPHLYLTEPSGMIIKSITIIITTIIIFIIIAIFVTIIIITIMIIIIIFLTTTICEK